MLGFMAVSGIVGWSNIRGLTLEVDLAEEIYSGRDTLLMLRLFNSKRFMPSFLLRVRLLGQYCDFNHLNRLSTEKDSLIASFAKRGNQVIESAEICSPFPVNFFVRCNRIPVHKKCVIFPVPIPNNLAANVTNVKDCNDFELSIKGYEGDVNRIRIYRWRFAENDSLASFGEAPSF